MNLLNTRFKLQQLIVLFRFLVIDTDDVTTHSCTLLWTPPNDDGGTPIIRYNIEQRETGRHTWSRLGSVKAEVNKYEVTKLSEGKEYEFQVKKC